MYYWTAIFFVIYTAGFSADCLSPVPQGFPDAWHGDKHQSLPCKVIQAPPAWLDGYLFCQLCASYGDRSNVKGQRMDHMFDAIGALGAFRLRGENSTFTGAYYPSRSYKIWNFNERDFKKSSVAWATFFSTVNVSALKHWEEISTDQGASSPNVDFWKIGHNVIAGTESYNLGLAFDRDTTSNFRQFQFKDTSPILDGQPLVPIQMPIHERVDPKTNLIWSTVSAVNVTAKPLSLHQVIFTVDQSGRRVVEGVFDFPNFDPSLCLEDGSYSGEKDSLPRYMHSITSTQNYIILPMTSSVLNPCALLRGFAVRYSANATLFDPVNSWHFKYAPDAPLTFLLFDKRTKEFLEPIEALEAQYVTHQMNAYESKPETLVMDMITYDSDPYDSLLVDTLTKPGDKYVATGHALRFIIDLDEKTMSNHSVLPQNPAAVEFPQINHKFEGAQYKYVYAVTFPYYAANHIVKVDVDSPTGINNKAFQPNGQSISLAEPYFVERPGAVEEDDGVLILRGLDISVNQTRIYVLDAKTMQQVGEILAPVLTPFGFHERFYTRKSLGGA